MQRIFALLAVALASVGLAFAQAPAAPKKDATKETTTATKPAAPAATPAAAPSAPAKDVKADAKAPAKDTKADGKKELVDVNSATEKELEALKGIGKARAAAIIKHRPYKGKDEIVKKASIPQTVYDEIKDQIIAKQK